MKMIRIMGSLCRQGIGQSPREVFLNAENIVSICNLYPSERSRVVRSVITMVGKEVTYYCSEDAEDLSKRLNC